MVHSFNSRYAFLHIPAAAGSLPFDLAVAEGLSASRKRLPCRFLYDTAGSNLFERICQLPEYYLTRTERAVLERYAVEIVAAAGDCIAIVEFGSGSSCKTRLLLEAALHQHDRLHYLPIDISADFLHASSLALLADYDRLSVTAVAAEYLDGIAALPGMAVPRLILFLGSSIGNFTTAESEQFLGAIRSQMKPFDRLLMGIDLLKDRSVIEAAYNDSEAVTAAFNKNMLARMNGELGAQFDLDSFEHYAPFVESESRIEMHLVSTRRQVVHVAGLNSSYAFNAGESIHTESSHKHSLNAFTALCHSAGFAVQASWTDDREWFGLLLLQPLAA